MTREVEELDGVVDNSVLQNIPTHTERMLKDKSSSGKIDQDNDEMSMSLDDDDGIGLEDSEEYNEYSTSCFKNFEDLIKDKTYRDFIQGSSSRKDSSGGKIGVIIDQDEKSKAASQQENQIFLNSTISTLISDLDSLIEQKLNNQQDPEDPDFKLIQLEETMNVLNLIHALYFSTTDEIAVLLINWVNRADIQPDLDLVQEILSTDLPYKSTLFWSQYVKKLITRGLFIQAVNVIRESKYQELEESENDLFLVIEDLITLVSNYNAVQFSNDNKQFISWKQKCCELRDNFKNLYVTDDSAISIKNSIFDILMVMTGLSSSILKSSSNWYECFLTKFLFELPSTQFITSYLTTSLSQFIPNSNDQESLLIWERACVDSMKGNYLKVVKSIEVLDKQTATYISVLFEAKGLYSTYEFLLSSNKEADDEDEDNINGQTISEMLLKDLALECLQHQNSMSVGVGILFNLNTPNTRELIMEYLPTYHCQSNDDLEWCLSICAKLRLHQTASIILQKNANELFEQGQLYESLVLFSRSGDLKTLSEKCWLIFENSLVESAKIEDELINALILDGVSDEDNDELDSGISDSLRQCLAPYAVFLKFLNYKKNFSDFKAAIKCLESLLKFEYLPKKYFILLLCQLLPFFHASSSSSIHFTAPTLQTLSQPQLLKILEMINTYDEEFMSHGGSKTEIEESEELYKTAISDEYKSKVKDKSTDWRYQLDLLSSDDENTSSFSFPDSITEMVLLIREKIGSELGRCFLIDDDQK